MSLTRIAARIAAVQALKGNTLVGDSVLDSQIGAIEVGADGNIGVGEESRFISVFTDASATASKDYNDRPFVPNGLTEIIFEAAISATMLQTDDETGVAYVVPGIYGTDQAFEFYLDMVMRQIGDTLTDPHNPWSQIFLKLAGVITKKEVARVSSVEGGVRLAAHRMTLTVEMIQDPVRGTILNEAHGLARFLAAAELLDDANITEQANIMNAYLAGDVSDWQQAMRRYAMTHGEADALIITPTEATS